MVNNWEKTIEPCFEIIYFRTIVYTTVGSTVTLICRVRNLGDRSVSLQILLLLINRYRYYYENE